MNGLQRFGCPTSAVADPRHPSRSLGTQRQQLEHRTMAVWPRPCLERPLLRRLDGMAQRARRRGMARKNGVGSRCQWNKCMFRHAVGDFRTKRRKRCSSRVSKKGWYLDVPGWIWETDHLCCGKGEVSFQHGCRVSSKGSHTCFTVKKTDGSGRTNSQKQLPKQLVTWFCGL